MGHHSFVAILISVQNFHLTALFMLYFKGISSLVLGFSDRVNIF